MQGIEIMLKRSLSTLGTVVVFTSMWVGQAHAYSSANSYSYNSQYQNSTALVKGEALRAATETTVDLIFNAPKGGNAHGAHVASTGISKGVAGGNHDEVRVWVNAGWTNPSNTGTSTKYTGDILQTFVGADYDVMDSVLGLAVGYEESNYATALNGGKRSGNGYTVAPYWVYQYNDMYSVQLAAGYSWLSYDLSRMAPMAYNTAGSNVMQNFQLMGSPDASRYFGAAELCAHHDMHNWHVMGKLGLMYGKESQDSFTDTQYTTNGTQGGFVNAKEDSRIGSLRIGADVSYPFEMLEPFVGAHYVWDFSRTKMDISTAQNGLGNPFLSSVTMANLTAAENDSSAVELKAGLRYRYDSVSFDVSAMTEQSRSDFDRTSVMANISASF